MEKSITIGIMIESEVRKQGMDITKFAKLINKTRSTAYNIFERNDIDISLLRTISIVLKRNFFLDLANNPDLACPVPIDEEELKRLRAVNQFLDVVPRVFEELNIDASIVFGTKQGIEREIPLPDFFLSKFNITFTIGQTYEEKCNGFWGVGVDFHHIEPESASKMVGYINLANGIQYWDIAIDYKTEEEWMETIKLALAAIDSFYLPRTWIFINDETNA